MKKNIVLMRLCKLLCLLLCLVLLSGLAADLSQYYDHNVYKLDAFYAEPKNTLDVVLLGASEVFTDFSSGYAYDLYGFTSYPYALDSNPGALYEAQLREILRCQNPKKIVVEINGFLYEETDPLKASGSLRRLVNNIPFTWNKVDTILKNANKEDMYFVFFSLAKDHERWKEWDTQWDQFLERLHFRRNGSVLKGNLTTLNTYRGPDHRDVSGDEATAPLEPVSESCLRSFLEFCKEEQVDNVIFVRFPHVISTDENHERFCRGNEAGQIIEEYGFEYLNLEKEFYQIGLEPEDFYNEDHMNIYGQQKFTDYFGRILAEEYGIMETKLAQGQYHIWDKAALFTRRFYELADQRMQKDIGSSMYENRELMEILDNWE